MLETVVAAESLAAVAEFDCYAMSLPSMSSELGHAYWSLIEPYWLPLNLAWDQGPERFLAQLNEVPTRVAHLYAAHWCQSEVCNGGFHQFFWNSTGLLAAEAAEGFREVGLPELSDIVVEAMAFFGDEYPRDRASRLSKLPEPNRRDREEWDRFFALDERFDAVLDVEGDGWERAADKYATSS